MLVYITAYLFLRCLIVLHDVLHSQAASEATTLPHAVRAEERGIGRRGADEGRREEVAEVRRHYIPSEL